MAKPKIDPARLAELQAVLEKLDPDRRRSWILEVFSEGGQPVARLDIKSGRALRRPSQRTEEVAR